MNSTKPSKQDKKKNPEDSLLMLWQRHKTLIAILSVAIPFTVGFNLFLYQWVITPMAEKRVLETEIEFIKNAKDIKEYYEGQIKDLKNIIDNKESELQSLRLKLEKLKNQGFDQREVELLKHEIDLKEKEIKFYREQISYLNEQLQKAREWIEKSTKSKRLSEALDSISLINNQPPMPPEEKREISKETSTENTLIAKQSPFRSLPTELSVEEVKAVLKKYDFFCQQYTWTKEFCNSTGKGFDNDFELKKNGQVVYDRKSGLMWQQSGSSSSYMYYESAKEWIKEINHNGYAGYNDWRLPTLEEAMSLMEPGQENGLYINPIFDSNIVQIWTSDPYYQVPLSPAAERQWVVFFYSAQCCSDDVGKSRCVRAVRSGQSS